MLKTCSLDNSRFRSLNQSMTIFAKEVNICKRNNCFCCNDCTWLKFENKTKSPTHRFLCKSTSTNSWHFLAYFLWMRSRYRQKLRIGLRLPVARSTWLVVQQSAQHVGNPKPSSWQMYWSYGFPPKVVIMIYHGKIWMNKLLEKWETNLRT